MKIQELESAVLALQTQIEEKDCQRSDLLLALEERRKNHQIHQRRLEQYEQEHLSMKAVIKESLDIARRVKRNVPDRCDVGVGPEQIV